MLFFPFIEFTVSMMVVLTLKFEMTKHILVRKGFLVDWPFSEGEVVWINLMFFDEVFP